MELVISSYLNDSTTFAALCKRKEFLWQPYGFPCCVTEEKITWKYDSAWRDSTLSSAIAIANACMSGLLFVI
jgi:hypothetical protein